VQRSTVVTCTRLVPDLDDELTVALASVEELLLTLAAWEDEDAGLGLPPPLAGRAALQATRRLWAALAPTQGERALQAGRTGRLLGPGGRYEHLPFRLAEVDPADVATLAEAARELGSPSASDPVREAVETGADMAYRCHDETSCQQLVMRAAQIAGLLDLAETPDTAVLRGLLETTGPTVDVVLTVDAEAAYQRLAGRFNQMWELGSGISRFLY
jgi:hypothetical protein